MVAVRTTRWSQTGSNTVYSPWRSGPRDHGGRRSPARPVWHSTASSEPGFQRTSLSAMSWFGPAPVPIICPGKLDSRTVTLPYCGVTEMARSRWSGNASRLTNGGEAGGRGRSHETNSPKLVGSVEDWMESWGHRSDKFCWYCRIHSGLLIPHLHNDDRHPPSYS